jgi:hypothetical protein
MAEDLQTGSAGLTAILHSSRLPLELWLLECNFGVSYR